MELGCGPGVAAALVCRQLETGHLLAIDRSAVAVSRTAQRNADRVTPVISDALTAHGFADVAVLKSEHGIGVSARSPEGP